MAEKSCSNKGCTKESCEGCPSKTVSYTHLEEAAGKILDKILKLRG